MDCGSSPHARGTRADYRRCRSGRRFIPACAGNASPARSGGPRGPVHPRMRGERTTHRIRSAAHGGSSPHARGTRSVFKTVLHRDRFIPACAGNAVSHGIDTLSDAVHPRMRGERQLAVQGEVCRHGSSPHARGTHLNGTHNPEKLRFIPACAGNAARADGRPGLVSVHPRMRGERSNRVA